MNKNSLIIGLIGAIILLLLILLIPLMNSGNLTEDEAIRHVKQSIINKDDRCDTDGRNRSLPFGITMPANHILDTFRVWSVEKEPSQETRDHFYFRYGIELDGTVVLSRQTPVGNWTWERRYLIDKTKYKDVYPIYFKKHPDVPWSLIAHPDWGKGGLIYPTFGPVPNSEGSSTIRFAC